MTGPINTDASNYFDEIPLAFAKGKLLFDSSQQPVDLIIEQANALFFELAGHSPSVILNHKLSEYSSEFKAIQSKYFGINSLKYDKNNPFARLDIFIKNQNKWFEVYIRFIDKQSLSIIINDFSERKSRESRVKAEKKKFEEVYDNASVGIYQAAFDGSIIMANKAMYNILETESSSISIKLDLSQEIYKKHLDSKSGFSGLISKWETEKGNSIIVRESFRPIYDIKGEIVHIDGTIEDITEESKAKDQIKNLNDIFTELDVDPYKNIEIIVKKTCEIMDGYCALYNTYNEENNTFLIWAVHNLPEMLNVEVPAKNTICYDYTLAKPNEVIIIEDIRQTKYLDLEGYIKNHKLRTYLGKSVIFDGKVIGSLCVFGKESKAFSATEQKIITTLATAISHEHKRFDLENDYKRAQSEAEFANRAKSQFLANMSHEIRTPLNGILGFSEMLFTQEINDQKKNMLRLIEESGNQLLQIVNDIFDYSLLDAGKIPLREGPFNLSELLSQTISFFTQAANQKGLDLITEFDGISHPELFGDYLKLNQILVNVLSNAIKFTDEGSVVIHAKTKKTKSQIEAQFIIEDTGIGINEDQLEAVFDEFKQLDFYLTKRIKGTGLGLAVTKKLVDFLQGRIFVESEPGTGSRFYINLPFRTAKAIKNELIMEETSNHQDAPIGKIKILLAEDNEANQFLIKAITKSKDWDITVVDDGEQAVEAFRKNSYNLILMDVQMPVMNGYEATALIRNIEKENQTHTPIVALTAYAMTSDKDQCIEAGMDDYISKPFKRQEFLDMVEKSLKIIE